MPLWDWSADEYWSRQLVLRREGEAVSDEINKAVERIRVARAPDYFLAESWREVIRAELLAAEQRGAAATREKWLAICDEVGQQAIAAESSLAALREEIEGMRPDWIVGEPHITPREVVRDTIDAILGLPHWTAPAAPPSTEVAECGTSHPGLDCSGKPTTAQRARELLHRLEQHAIPVASWRPTIDYFRATETTVVPNNLRDDVRDFLRALAEGGK